MALDHIIAVCLGAAAGIGLFVIAPMSANYACHGSVFLPSDDPRHEHSERGHHQQEARNG